VLLFCHSSVGGQDQPAHMLVTKNEPLMLPQMPVNCPNSGVQLVVYDKSGVDRWTINAARIPQPAAWPFPLDSLDAPVDAS